MASQTPAPVVRASAQTQKRVMAAAAAKGAAAPAEDVALSSAATTRPWCQTAWGVEEIRVLLAQSRNGHRCHPSKSPEKVSAIIHGDTWHPVAYCGIMGSFPVTRGVQTKTLGKNAYIYIV
jgi:hypothetical protein